MQVYPQPITSTPLLSSQSANLFLKCYVIKLVFNFLFSLWFHHNYLNQKKCTFQLLSTSKHLKTTSN